MFQNKIPNDVINSWRATLDGANARIVQQVSGSMAEVIANQSIGRIPDWAALAPGIETIGRRVAEQLEPYLANVGRVLQSDLQRWIQPAALAAATDFSTRMKGANDRFRRYQQALRERGWWMPPSVPMHVFWEIGRLADEGPKTKLRQRMVQLGTSTALGDVLDVDRLPVDGHQAYERLERLLPTVWPPIAGALIRPVGGRWWRARSSVRREVLAQVGA